MRLAFSVDNHVDVNRLDAAAVAAQQAAYLTEQGIDYYINAGDTFNDFGKTRDFFHHLAALAPHTVVRFLAGNHDLVQGIDYATAQGPADPLYLHERTLAVPGTDTVIIGNNGWYDYTLAPVDLGKTPAEFAQWKRAYWIDGAIPQPVSDQARMNRVLATTEAALDASAGKRVIYVTHFVPTPLLMVYAPDHPRWQMATAVMGSARLGQLLESRRVADVVFGHLHRRDAPLTVGQTTYWHRPMGYGIARLNEWATPDWFTEWRRTLVVLQA
ncbi:metallophosphoesterase [Lacticaseibacillus kribbianus]|uniref:metallophosphoesterase n=1 Tax=Lacticaseibacillus kribbianus TaxID=2926292 RepID=UPI001CD4193D|nr:metallophosphoesterase [Lacticaseibacillus kribbianus]